MEETVLEVGGRKGGCVERDAGGMREGCSSSPSRGKRVERGWRGNDGKAGGEEDGRGGVEGVPIYTSILNLLR